PFSRFSGICLGSAHSLSSPSRSTTPAPLRDSRYLTTHVARRTVTLPLPPPMHDTRRLIEQLADPAAYPHPVAGVAVRQTPISVVVLGGPFAYKLKKPVRLGFLDFSTPALRRHFCEEEVRLNRRLAPHVYLGVEPVTDHDGRLRLGGSGQPIDWAVK